MTGVIKNVNYESGFFFVTGDDDGRDYFVHRSALPDAVILDELRRGDTVLLVTTENTPKGWRANSVVPQAALSERAPAVKVEQPQRTAEVEYKDGKVVGVTTKPA